MSDNHTTGNQTMSNAATIRKQIKMVQDSIVGQITENAKLVDNVITRISKMSDADVVQYINNSSFLTVVERDCQLAKAGRNQIGG